MTVNHSALSFTRRISKKARVGSGWLEWCSLAGGVDVFSVERWVKISFSDGFPSFIHSKIRGCTSVKYPLGTSAFQIEPDSSTIGQRATHISKRPVAIELCESLDNPSASQPTNRKNKKKNNLRKSLTAFYTESACAPIVFQGPRSYFESGGAENTLSSVTLNNFQKSGGGGGGGGLKPPQPLPLRWPCLYQPNRSQTTIVGSQLLQHRPSR